MAWRPGPAIDAEKKIDDHDERDPWIKRFISRTDDGELSLDVEAMSGLERAAGAIFTELVRHRAEPQLHLTMDSGWPPRMLERRGGIASRQERQLPPSEVRSSWSLPLYIPEEFPMAQYEPFRNTYVDDPRYIPQLRFANVSDSGANYHEGETDRHWRRTGRTWSRVPRFQSGRTVFAHDPCYKPPQAIVDKWYMTEVGPKASLMVRTRESRWQSCHSKQTGRLRKKTMRSKVPPQPDRPTPGPTHYRLRDPWKVKEVCGTIPPSRVFCPPVHRVRPRTTEFSCAFTVADSNNRRNPYPPLVRHAASAAAAAGIESEFSTQTHRKTRRHQQAAAAAASVVPANASVASFISVTSDVSLGRSERSSPYGPRASAVATVSPSKARWSHAPAGPLSFARAERPSVTDEITRREDSYGKRAVRLMTNRGDVLMTVNRRKHSAWGDSSGRPARRTDGRDASTNMGNVTIDAQNRGRSSKNPQLAAAIPSPRKRPALAPAPAAAAREEGSRGVPTSTPSIQSRAVPGEQGWCARSDGTLKALATKFLPADLASTLPAYREPGRAELPAIFCAKPAPLVKIDVGADASSSLRSSARTRKGGMLTNPDGAGDGCCTLEGGVAPGTDVAGQKGVQGSE